VLWLRQLVQDADELALTSGYDNPEVKTVLVYAVTLFREHFLDPTDKYHQLARPFYERALQVLGKGIEIEVALAGREGGLEKARAKPQRMWVLDQAELKQQLDYQTQTVLEQMTLKPVHVDPYVNDAPLIEAVPV
jgi:hypothetical protein